MRSKIIAVNALIVVIVGLMAFFFVRMAESAAGTKADQLMVEAKQDVQGAAARFQLDGIAAEQFLTVKAGEAATIDALMKSGSAAGDAATQRCNAIQAEMKNVEAFAETVPTLVALVDLQGKIIGRNGTNLQRGDDLGAAYPLLKSTTLTTGQPGADVWVNGNDKFLASYVALHDASGKLAGALVAGRPLSDVLSRVSDQTTGRPVAVAVAAGDDFNVVAGSSRTDAAMDNALKNKSSGVAQSIRKTLRDGHGSDVGQDGDVLVASASLPALANGTHDVVISSLPAVRVSSANELLPIVAATILGIVFVVVSGWVLGNYITRPIATLEEGLLAILNGQTDKRFELDHAELGGLAFRIDQLLNQLMGVEEDTTDAEGRVSRPPSAAHFSEAMGVEPEKSTGGLAADAVARLAAEPEQQYYARIYREYITAKKALGEPTDHITEQAFVQRIQGMEKDLAQKHGKPVRYQVQANDKEVVLLAIPLG